MMCLDFILLFSMCTVMCDVRVAVCQPFVKRIMMTNLLVFDAVLKLILISGFNANSGRCKVISGRELRQIGRRREPIGVIETDVLVRTLGSVHRWRNVSQDWRLVDLSADSDPKRQYKTGRYADVGALSTHTQHTWSINQSVNLNVSGISSKNPPLGILEKISQCPGRSG